MAATNIDRLVGIFTDTCDAIRDKTGSPERFVATDIPSAIAELPMDGFDYSGLACVKFYYLNDADIDVSDLDTTDFTDMSSMFNHCPYVTSLDCSNFDTFKTTKMNYMFYSCSRLESVDVSSFDTSNVTNFNYLFQNDAHLTSLNLQSFTTQSATSTNAMIRGCTNLTDIIWAIDSTVVEPMPTASTFDKVSNTVPSDLTIYVRTSLVAAYQNATNWTRYWNIIKPISQLPQSLQELYNIDPNDYQ